MSEGVFGGHVRTDISNVLVIGSGAAGLRAAIAAHEAGTEVVIVGKCLKKDAHAVLAAGGTNAALGTVDPEDSWQQHFADTLREGYFLSDPRVVEIMAREAPQAINELVEYGCPFARTEGGELDQRFFTTATTEIAPGPARGARGGSPDEGGGILRTHVVSRVRQP